MVNRKVIVTGGAGFLGTYVVEALKSRGYVVSVPRSKIYDLRAESDTIRMFDHFGDPLGVINLAANVGGIGYNMAHPAELFYDNLRISSNVIHESCVRGVERFVQLGTVCAYPDSPPVPFKEESLWDGYPQVTNAPYGIAKKVSLVHLETLRGEFGFNGVYLIPTNLYGPGDSFDEGRSHVIPAIIKKLVYAHVSTALVATLWGSGKATRDFLYVQDAADAIIKAFESYNDSRPINLGSGIEVSILELADMIAHLVGFEGAIIWNKNRPMGQLRRVLSTTRAKELLDWVPKVTLEDGLKKTVEWYLGRIE